MFFVSLLVALAVSFPSSSKTSWMSPQSFRLVIGMERAEALKTLSDAGWTIKPGRDKDEKIVDCADDKAVTLQFDRDRLRSVRFELFGLTPDIRAAFEEEKASLEKEHGAPKKGVRGKSIVVYDDRLPNIMVVLNDDPKSEYGKKGVAYLAVRYYDPVAEAAR